MSFLIAVYVNEGIVLASDRRTTYANTFRQNYFFEIQILRNINHNFNIKAIIYELYSLYI